MRRLSYPGVWLALWVLALAAVAVGSLLPPSALPDAPRVNDKFMHVLMYFVLMAAAVQLFRGRRVLVAVALGLAAYGLLLEFAQGAWTASRAFEWADALANAAGVALGALVAATPLARGLHWFERRALPERRPG